MTELDEIPEDWEVKEFRDIVDVINGGTPDTKINEYWAKADILWATPTDITSSGKYIKSTGRCISELGLSKSSANILPVGSILMTSRATIGEKSINLKPMATNQGFKSLICKENVSNEFVYYMLDLMKENLINLASGSTFLEISKKAVENYKIISPPFKQQQKIASILSSVDEHIEQVDMMIEDLKQLKKGLMQKLLTGQYVLEGGKLTKTKEFKKTSLGMLPLNWNIVNMKSISQVINGDRSSNYPSESDLKNEGILFLSTNNIKNNKLNLKNTRFITEDKFESLNNGKLKKNDLVITLRGTIGSIMIFNEKKYNTGFINAQMAIVRPENISTNYLYYFLISNLAQSQLSKSTTGSAQPQLTGKDLNDLKIIVPSISEQNNISTILLSTTQRLELFESEKQDLQQLKKGLMQQLLTGKTRVKTN